MPFPPLRRCGGLRPQAGVVIGLFVSVAGETGSVYRVQGLMTAVTWGAGNIRGMLAGALMIGGIQKGIGWHEPSNTAAAQTRMIICIQFRRKGIIQEPRRVGFNTKPCCPLCR